jgi:hypothetical protein
MNRRDWDSASRAVVVIDVMLRLARGIPGLVVSRAADVDANPQKKRRRPARRSKDGNQREIVISIRSGRYRGDRSRTCMAVACAWSVTWSRSSACIYLQLTYTQVE